MEGAEFEKFFLEFQKEACERDARLETSLGFINERLDNFEGTLKQMSQILSEQKHLSTVVDRLAAAVNTIDARINALEQKVAAMQSAPAKNFYETFKKIVWIAVPLIVGAACTFLGAAIKSAIAQIGG